MTSWLTLAWVSAGLNVVVLLLLGAVWVRKYREHGASHTLGFLVIAAFLLVENSLWLYFYLLDQTFRGWFLATSTPVQIGVTMLCSLELVALLVLARITWQ